MAVEHHLFPWKTTPIAAAARRMACVSPGGTRSSDVSALLANNDAPGSLSGSVRKVSSPMTRFSLQPSDWVVRPHPVPQADLRLFCLPYGGGDASLFTNWPAALPPQWRDRLEICPIQLPGRAHRRHERPLCTSLSALIELLAPPSLETSPLFPFLEKPFAVFGASLFGGWIGFELLRALQVRHQREAVVLGVAACRAPHLPGPSVLDERTAFAEAERRSQTRASGAPRHARSGDEERASFASPRLTADALVMATYAYIPGLALDCPIMAIGGSHDPVVSKEELAEWRRQTRGDFRLHTLSGDHFLVRDASPEVRRQLLEALCLTIEISIERQRRALRQTERNYQRPKTQKSF